MALLLRANHQNFDEVAALYCLQQMLSALQPGPAVPDALD
jgi:hypothetical protein